MDSYSVECKPSVLGSGEGQAVFEVPGKRVGSAFIPGALEDYRGTEIVSRRRVDQGLVSSRSGEHAAF